MGTTFFMGTNPITRVTVHHNHNQRHAAALAAATYSDLKNVDQ